MGAGRLEGMMEDFIEEEDDTPHNPHTIRNALVGAAAAFAGCYLVYQYPWLCLAFAGGVACALGYKKHDSA